MIKNKIIKDMWYILEMNINKTKILNQQLIVS